MTTPIHWLPPTAKPGAGARASHAIRCKPRLLPLFRDTLHALCGARPALGWNIEGGEGDRCTKCEEAAGGAR